MPTANNTEQAQAQLREGKLHQEHLQNSINYRYKVLLGISILSMITAMILHFTVESIYAAAFFMTLSIVTFFRLALKSVLYRQRDIEVASGVYCDFEYDENSIILFSKTRFRKEILYKNLSLLDFRVYRSKVYIVVFKSMVIGKPTSRDKLMFPMEKDTFYALLSFLRNEQLRGNPSIADMKLTIGDY